MGCRCSPPYAPGFPLLLPRPISEGIFQDIEAVSPKTEQVDARCCRQAQQDKRGLAPSAKFQQGNPGEISRDPATAMCPMA
eukprot:CAMPEP_0184328784 /NCGR_PEP_ID=MMETSP1049-20130417/143805_1 /TAXON_ID=77928 /ORGANISM="Proteomonas sulcata, Strain CCMP704" /LENGTH=80 /DNA_ID=CAMNT_0026651115 /DNA_START=417 /DNA_END=659 /DNA_ORIENTATION=-